MVSREEVKGQVLHFLRLHGKVPWRGGVALVVVEWFRVYCNDPSEMQTGAKGDGSDAVEDPVDLSRWETMVMEEASHVSSAVLEGGEAVRARELEIVNMEEGIRGIMDVSWQAVDKWREDGVK
eukprot:g28085.t1